MFVLPVLLLACLLPAVGAGFVVMAAMRPQPRAAAVKKEDVRK
jgi:hypothetical protein